MSYLPLPTSSELDFSQTSASLEPSQRSNYTALLTVLRDALATETHPPDTILRAIADTARIATAANGTAIALRTNGVVVCRARSGDIAPELGTSLNVDWGISGECFRTSRSLRCDDTQTDNRLEPEVCRFLGIRSIAAVPVRGPMGTLGIVEVFSSQANAFTDEQISFLKSLGEITEAAYQQESGAETPTPAQASASFGRSEALATSTAREESPSPAILHEPVPKTKRRYWIPGGAAALVLLASAIVWRTWHKPVGEFTPSQPMAQALTAPLETSNVTAPTVFPSRPSPGIANGQPDKSRTKGVVRNAANIEAVEDPLPMRSLGASTKNIILPASSKESTLRSSTSSPAVEPPPTVVAGTPENSDKLANIVSAPALLPGLEVRISQGVTQANIIRQIAPMYPQQARSLGLEGSVTLDASVAEDGTIREVKVLHGQPILAAAAVAAVHQWRYTPSLLNGKPTPVQREITIIFKLR
jgi:TonB family protein